MPIKNKSKKYKLMANYLNKDLLKNDGVNSMYVNKYEITSSKLLKLIKKWSRVVNKALLNENLQLQTIGVTNKVNASYLTIMPFIKYEQINGTVWKELTGLEKSQVILFFLGRRPAAWNNDKNIFSDFIEQAEEEIVTAWHAAINEYINKVNRKIKSIGCVRPPGSLFNIYKEEKDKKKAEPAVIRLPSDADWEKLICDFATCNKPTALKAITTVYANQNDTFLSLEEYVVMTENHETISWARVNRILLQATDMDTWKRYSFFDEKPSYFGIEKMRLMSEIQSSFAETKPQDKKSGITRTALLFSSPLSNNKLILKDRRASSYVSTVKYTHENQKEKIKPNFIFAPMEQVFVSSESKYLLLSSNSNFIVNWRKNVK